jgi:pyruvate,water dikinase
VPLSPPTLVALSAVDTVDPDLVGGKARGFDTIARAGLAAPDGFVVTASVHEAARLDGGDVPSDVAAEIARAVSAIGDVPLAVRSSARGEDGADSSHAGQYLTRLGVRGPDEVLRAILECWASAADGRAEAYRAHRGHDGPVAMAVIVQRLVDGQAAGVCMSCDPLTGDPGTIVVNAAYGLGELVVSGLVTPDDYRLARADGRLVRFEPGYKDIKLVMGPAGPEEVPVAEDLREARVLDDRTLTAVFDGVLRCEDELGGPADCEFSVVGDRIVWLQCRPMTALAPDAPIIDPPTSEAGS